MSCQPGPSGPASPPPQQEVVLFKYSVPYFIVLIPTAPHKPLPTPSLCPSAIKSSLLKYMMEPFKTCQSLGQKPHSPAPQLQPPSRGLSKGPGEQSASQTAFYPPCRNPQFLHSLRAALCTLLPCSPQAEGSAISSLVLFLLPRTQGFPDIKQPSTAAAHFSVHRRENKGGSKAWR